MRIPDEQRGQAVAAGLNVSVSGSSTFLQTTVHDVIIDCIGALFALLLCAIFARRRGIGFQPMD
jgi:hypothetical protein